MIPFIVAASLYLVNGSEPAPVAWFLLPGDTLRIDLTQAPDTDTVRWMATRGEFIRKDSSGATWKAPEGAGPSWIGSNMFPDSVLVFSMVPYDSLKKGTLFGYRIGTYPDPRARGASAMIKAHPDAYEYPLGFIMVPESLRDMHISPKFTLGQFVCREPDTWPRFIYLKRDHIVFLEELADSLGVPGFTIISGYRSPWYNRKKGRGRWSRHQFGDATDIMIDLDSNWVFDDVNGDHKVDVNDVLVIADAVERLKKKWGKRFGMGMYFWGRRGTRTPFIHVDSRGFESWWNPKEWRCVLSPEDEEKALVDDQNVMGLNNLAMKSLGFLTSLPGDTGQQDTVPDPQLPRLGKGWRKLISPTKRAVFAYPDTNARVWQIRLYDAKAKRLWSYGPMLWARPSPGNKPPEAVGFSPDGEKLALFHGKTLYVFGKKGLLWHRTLTRALGDDTASLAFSDQGDILYLTKSGRAYCFDVSGDSLLWARKGGYREVKLMDTGDLAALNGEGSLEILDPLSGAKLREFNWQGLGYKGHQCLDIQALSGGRVALWFAPRDESNTLGPFYMIVGTGER